MADKETTIEYTQEELNEIDRIIDVVNREISPPFTDDALSQEEKGAEEEGSDSDFLDEITPGEIPIDEPIGEPDDLDLPSGDLDIVTGEDVEGIEMQQDISPAGDAAAEIPSEEITGLEPDLLESVTGVDEMEAIPEEITDVPGEPAGEARDEEILDISDIIEEVEEPGVQEEDLPDLLDELAPSAEPEEIEPLDEMGEIDSKEEQIPEIDEISDLEGEEAHEPASPEEASPLDQLNALTEDEPESIDLQDYADDQFVGGGEIPAVEDAEPEVPEEQPDDAMISEPEALAEDVPEEVTLEKDEDADIPDLSELPVEDISEIPEAEDIDIPEIELDAVSESAGDAETPTDEDFMPPESTEAQAYDEGVDMDIQEPEDIDVADISESVEDVPGGVVDISDAGDEPLVIEPLDEDEGIIEKAEDGPVETEEALELSDNELKKLKKAILLFNPALIKEIKNTIINDLLPADEIRQMIDMILSGRPEDNIHRFLEKKLKKKIDLLDEAAVPGRKVITSRPEYTREGRERQKRIVRLTKIFGSAAAAAFVLTIVGYQFVYKPIMAKKIINEGAAIILSSGDYQKKHKDYNKAELLFKQVNEDYVKNFIYGYNAYGRAYFEKGQYERSLKKLDEAYKIDSTNVDTLNQLGYFYSKVPAENYKFLKESVNKKYYKEKKLSPAEKTQLNIAVDFFRRALIIEKDNITSLIGIGNAYFYQGQYLKAKKYYEDILRVDRDSVIGYSGLLNLYIERNAFPQAASIFNDLREKEMLQDMPSALLGKLAEYFLSKRRTKQSNVRIDYGVRSPRLKDIDDNTYPAVNTVLMALNKRDPKYPPLQLHFANLNRAQKNNYAEKRYIERALKLSPDYFDALNFMGEYYYNAREPVNAYRYLNRAVRSYGNQPSFTREDFYKGLSQIGKTYLLLGNIFYYFFDRVSFRFGSLEDDLVDSEADKLANYNVARDKYEKALSENYRSPELHYNLGRIYYLNKLYKKALNQWLNLYEEFVNSPELMFALGNAFYHLGNFEAGKGEYLKLISVLERDAESIKFVEASRKGHIKLFGTLSSAYNNLGAIYQLQKDESRSGLSYWKAVDYAKRLGIENHFARVNLARSYRPNRKVEPVIDENIPYSIDIFREDMRQ